MPQPLKRLIEASLVDGGVARLARARRVDRALVLAFHNIVPDDAPPVGDASLHLARRRFASFLDHLQRCHEVVSLKDALEPRCEPASGRPRVAITFDDAYRGAVTLGIDELGSRGLPATFFVAPSFVPDGTFWWDAYGGGATGGWFESFRRHALTELRGEDPEIRKWARSRGITDSPLPAHCRVASEAELQVALETPGIEFGSHTWTHPNLARLNESEIRDELDLSRAWLADHGTEPRWLSYPYGESSASAARIASDLGYEAALLIRGGWIDSRSGSGRYAIPRLNVPAALTRRGFILRAAGL